MEEKKTFTLLVNDYTAPVVETVEASVESGFEGSTGGTGSDMEWG